MSSTSFHKHSFSVPSTPASYAPTSPLVTRSVKSDRYSAAPVTPQRLPYGQMLQFRSPATPLSTNSTPYTPLSLRSFSSSNGSTLTTPGSASSVKRLSFPESPEVALNNKDKSLADIAKSWRSRASEHGIKVSSCEDHYADDEASERTLSDADYITTEEALRPPPYMNAQRRARAQSQAAPPCAPLSPQVTRTPVRRTLATLNTPPPKPTNMQHLKLKGSLTDPAHTRRRLAFGHSTELFDIDENEYTPYPQSFCSPVRPTGIPLALNDLFQAPALPTISESTQQHFHDFQLHYRPEPQEVLKPAPIDAAHCSVCGRDTGPLAILEPCTHPLCSACLTSALNIVGEKDMECAVCKTGVDNFHLQAPAAGSGTQAKHAKNNSRDEKSGMSGKSFFDPLISPTSSPNRSSPRSVSTANKSALLPSAFDTGCLGDLNDRFQFFEGARDVSTPVPIPSGAVGAANAPYRARDNVVLRIDNVPWDITPPVIRAWLKQPVERVHVLLDRKGKTLSHAFVEVVNEEVAKATLRGAQNSVLGKGKRARGVTVTRSGQEELMRALFPSWRGMFDGSRPSLAGLDNESVISALATGLISDTELNSLLHLIRSPDSHFLKVPSLPFHSLISLLNKFPSDVDSRVFWSGTLRDNFYGLTYAAIQILLAQVHGNDNTSQGNDNDNLELLSELVRVAMDCQAFTAQQLSRFSELLDSSSLTYSSYSPHPHSTYSAPSSMINSGTSSPAVEMDIIRTPESDARGRDQTSFSGAPSPFLRMPSGERDRQHEGWHEHAMDEHQQIPFGALAREFGLEAQVVQALAMRLSGMGVA